MITVLTYRCEKIISNSPIEDPDTVLNIEHKGEGAQ